MSTLALPVASPETVRLPRVIRREPLSSGDHRVVPWMGHKIEQAVQRACAAAREGDTVCRAVRLRIEQRLQTAAPHLIHVEQIQDLVEESLLELGKPQIALAYAKYRARRAALREMKQPEPAPGGLAELTSPELVADVRERIDFARIGLRLNLDAETLLERLLRSVSLQLSAPEIRDTVVLNAKSLLDLDADFPAFSGRILLSLFTKKPCHGGSLTGSLGSAKLTVPGSRSISGKESSEAESMPACWNSTSLSWPMPSIRRRIFSSTFSVFRPSTIGI
jgi:ribonucleoside-diphosphate reductase alpha chain